MKKLILAFISVALMRSCDWHQDYDQAQVALADMKNEYF